MMKPTPSMGHVRTVVRLLIIATPLYFAWEMLQAPAFTGLPDDWRAATAMCFLAAVGDSVIVLLLYGLGALLFQDAAWFRPPRIGRYLIVVVVAVGLQIAVELVAVYALGWWGYSPQQPPVTGIGLLAIVQPIVLLPSTLWMLSRWTGR